MAVPLASGAFRRSIGAAVCLALIASCGSVPPRPVSPQASRVGRIHVSGAQSIDVGDLIAGLGLAYARDNGRPFERYLVTLDRQRIRGYYVRRGFFEVAVESSLQPVRGATDVTFTVTEGARSRLGRIEVIGLPAASPIAAAELRARIPLRDGSWFDHDAWEQARPDAVASLTEAGYAHVRVHDTVFADPARREAVIRLVIEPGPITRFGPISLTGVDGELAAAVRARLVVREGERYTPSAIADTRAAIYEMDRFSAVRIESDLGARDPIVPIAIELVEAKRHELRLGGGVGVNPAFYEARARASYTVASWPTPLTTSRVELRPAIVRLREEPETDPRLEALANIERLDLFWPRVRGDLEAGFDYLSIEAYTSVGPRVRLGLRTPLRGGTVLLAAGWQLRGLRFTDLHPALDDGLIDTLGLRGTYMLGFYEQTVLVDLRDDPVAPRLGLYGELRLEEGTPAAAGELGYVKVVPELRGYLPIGPLVLGARARAGAIVGDVPVTQRFFSGGANNQRGFPERRLSPYATRVVDESVETVPFGGGGVLELGAEVRAPLGTVRDLQLGGVVFVEGADVRERIEDVEPARLHWAAGVGLRVATPIGPFRVDAGYRLNRAGPSEPLPGDRITVHVSIGEAF